MLGVSAGRAASPVLLTIAGFDPSSGAGATADLAVFAAHGCFGISALTALTVQSTRGVYRVEPVDAGLLEETLARLEEDLPPAAVKIGMLGGEPQARAVSLYLRRIRARGTIVVLDPVLRSSSGAVLLDKAGVGVLQEELLPLVDVATPNRRELAWLAGAPCGSDGEVEQAAAVLQERYPQCAIVATGGDEERADDFLLHRRRGTWMRGKRIVTRATHGTGCAFSSALACRLAAGASMEEASAGAKVYVTEAIRRATPRGAGRGPLDLLWPLVDAASGGAVHST